MSREKFSLPTTEERYDERCILERWCGLIFVASSSEMYLEMIGSVRSIARDSSWLFFFPKIVFELGGRWGNHLKLGVRFCKKVARTWKKDCLRYV